MQATAILAGERIDVIDMPLTFASGRLDIDRSNLALVFRS